jgi:SAM-dependent methyltransferase
MTDVQNTLADASCCIACQQNDWRDEPTVTRVVRSAFAGCTVVRCRRCGLGRLNPMPPAEDVQAIYQDSLYTETYDAAGQAFVIADADARSLLQPRFDRLAKYLPSKGTVLDIGASRGIFLNAARAAGWEPCGIEAGADAIGYAKEHYDITIQPGTLESSVLVSNSYDCVHMSHVLEHMHDPQLSLCRVADCLRPGGIAVIEVPFEFGDLFDRFRETILRRMREANQVPSTHLYFFTIASLSRLLVRCGFEILHATTPRRNQSYDSRIPLGKSCKRALYTLEQSLRMGPLIEIYARKRTKLENHADV